MTDKAKKVVDALRKCSDEDTTSCNGCTYENLCDKYKIDFLVEKDAADMIERLSEVNERLRYTLQGVMHFVDKWIDGEPYCDIDDPDGKIAVNRAAEAREIALKEIEKLGRERDAAVRDARLGGHCKKCIFEDGSPECEGCCFGFGNNDNWQWRGVCAENSGGGN